jgi:hypothetical protein
MSYIRKLCIVLCLGLVCAHSTVYRPLVLSELQANKPVLHVFVSQSCLWCKKQLHEITEYGLLKQDVHVVVWSDETNWDALWRIKQLYGGDVRGITADLRSWLGTVKVRPIMILATTQGEYIDVAKGYLNKNTVSLWIKNNQNNELLKGE